jgi:diguanylate cyclase (GGDEF)-like protein/PAS domain S-box-containing protein
VPTVAAPLNIGVLSPLAGGFYFGGILAGITATVTSAGGRVIAIQTLDAGREHADDVGARPFDSLVAASHIDGYISVLNAVDPARLEAIQDAGKPVVMVSNEIPGLRCPIVSPDNRAGIFQAVRHLVEHGHTRIAFAGFLDQLDMRERCAAYEAALRECGLQPDPELILETGDTLRSGGERAAARMLRLPDFPTATIAATDFNAIGMMSAFTAAGFVLPRDHAIIGFDDTEAADYVTPALSSVRQDFGRVGNRAAQLLLQLLAGEPVEEGHHLVLTSLSVRQSCGCQPWTPTNIGAEESSTQAPAEVLAHDLAEAVAPSADPFGDHDKVARFAQRVAVLIEDTAMNGGGRQLRNGELRAAMSELYALSPTRACVSAVIEALRRYGATRARDRATGQGSRATDDAVLAGVLAVGAANLSRSYDENMYFRTALAAQYDVTMALLRGHDSDPRTLHWLERTRANHGVLALWDDADKSTLTIAGSFSRSSDTDVAQRGGELALEAFPPSALFDVPTPGEVIYAVPVKSGNSDWGWLATVGPIESRVFTGRETLNQWAALLTVALDESAAAEGVRSLEREMRAILETSPDAIARYDAQLRYAYLNASAARSIGLPPERIVGRTDHELGRDASVTAVWEAGLREVLVTAAATEIEFSEGASSDAHWYQTKMVPQFDNAGSISGVLTSTRDITATKRAELALAHQAVHDSLTGLANRVLLMDRLAQTLTRMEREPGRLAVLFVDLDHFKEINDSLGHEVGDTLLCDVARRLEGVSRRVDTVARFGGDEFVMLCDKLSAEEDVRIIAERVVRALAQPYVHEGEELPVSGSIGVVVTSDPYVDVDSLIRDADSAMYQAKARSGNRFFLFDPELRDRATARCELESDLRHAVERGELCVAYQPLFSLGDGAITGVEALLRWNHPTRGLLSPADFMALAEQRGFIVDIGAWVIDEACRQLAEWSADAELANLTMAVNISSRQLADPSIVAVVRDALTRHGIGPARLSLEMTETTLIEDAASVRDTLTELAALGVHLALDDFGTGYSALAHLRDFSVDILKIDRSFVEQLGDGGRAREMVGALTAMAHFLDMSVVGEGIETSKQWEELKNVACDDGQGFLMAKPMAPDDLVALVKRARSS